MNPEGNEKEKEREREIEREKEREMAGHKSLAKKHDQRSKTVIRECKRDC